MLKYIFKRILMMIPVLLGVLFLVFTMNEISPGDPAAMIAGDAAPWKLWSRFVKIWD